MDTQYSGATLNMNGTQVTESEGNQWPLPKRSGLRDIGSEFFSQKFEVISPLGFSKNYVAASPPSDTYNRVFEGTLMAGCLVTGETSRYWSTTPQPLKFNWPPDMSSSRHDLEVLGTKAVALSSPGNQVANAASFVGELLQDVPNIPGMSTWKARLQAVATVGAVADEFLNWVFAVAPTISDMKQFLDAAHTVDKAVDQLVRDSGKVVRRRYYFPEERSTTFTAIPFNYSPAGWALDKVLGTSYGWIGCPNTGSALPCYQTVRERTIERKQWFSGAFTYHIPNWYDTKSEMDRKRLMAQLYGGKPDLNTLWQLTPWSWAVDWISNAGSVVKNLQSLQDYGTILRYGYMMEQTTVTDTYSAGAQVGTPGRGGMNSSPRPYIAPVTLRVTTKKRVMANPFGFGLSWDGLNTTQKAILAALGITRGSHSSGY